MTSMNAPMYVQWLAQVIQMGTTILARVGKMVPYLYDNLKARDPNAYSLVVVRPEASRRTDAEDSASL